MYRFASSSFSYPALLTAATTFAHHGHQVKNFRKYNKKVKKKKKKSEKHGTKKIMRTKNLIKSQKLFFHQIFCLNLIPNKISLFDENINLRK